jgi:predicted ferric reductase
MNSVTAFTLRTRMVLGGTCILLWLLLIAAAWTIPFFFESSSIFYKFGVDKTFLRSGKVLGLTSAVLVFFQVLLVSRIRFLDRIFSLNRIYTFHRINGIAIALMALLHPILVLTAGKFTIFSFEKRYWPEFLGVGLLIFILVLVITANWRPFFGFAYNKWLRLHRPGALVTLAFMTIHILFVSETFKSGLPRVLVFVAACLSLVLILRLWCRRVFLGKRRYIISNVAPAGKDAFAVDARPDEGRIPDYIPGQFAFIKPLSAGVPMEEHPFTLSSTPSRPNILQFVIRSLGDWTSKINHLKAEETILIDGPYGLFSHMVSPGDEPVIMIAGGIGITPMLSMLRYMTDVNDQRQTLLIWSNRTKENIVFPEEFENFKQRLQHLKIINFFTREPGGGDTNKRLDQVALEKMMDGYSQKSRVFICGPPGMMKVVGRALKNIGFSSSTVYKEEFRF